MAKIIKKPTPKKKKTLIPEPNWDKLKKSETEEERIAAWHECESYVHGEITDKEYIHSMKKWVRDHSGWNVGERLHSLPDVFLLIYAKSGWKFYKLGWMPELVRNNLEQYVRPLYDKAERLRDQMSYEPSIHPSLLELEEDHDLHPDKVKEWIRDWKSYLVSNKSHEECKDIDLRLKYQTAQSYVHHMQMYLRTGIWLDSNWGANRQFKTVPVCVALAYDENGVAKRTKGVFYPDIGMIWKN